MAQHYNIYDCEVKYCKKITTSIKAKFSQGIEKVRGSLRFIEETNPDAKEHIYDSIFNTRRLVGNEFEQLEIHFDKQKKVVTKIYVVK